jgi:para-nitrobenzyl esterase
MRARKAPSDNLLAALRAESLSALRDPARDGLLGSHEQPTSKGESVTTQGANDSLNTIMTRRTALAGLTAAAATGVGLLSSATRAATPSDPVVETTAGKVRGERLEGGGFKFSCVPYGASTEGAGRFMPPKPAVPWAGIRDVPKQPLIAPQIDPNATTAQPGSVRAAIQAIGSEAGSLETEDCLNVTIYTPAVGSGRRPVMFWCHGGGYFAGSGSAPMYDGSRLAVRGDVVVVNVTHRLNALGYAHLPASGADFASSGNVGMMDIELALRWVRDNIERFGGDPKRVMIFGQSGGGGKVSVLTAMPSAKGLFHRAVMQSGALRQVRSAQDAAATGEALLAQLGLKPNQARDAQKIPLAKLMAANFALGKLPPQRGRPTNFAPVFEGKIVPRHPFDPVANPLNADVPLVIGTVRTENTAFMLGDEAAFKLDGAALKTRMRALLGERTGDAAIALYSELKPQASPSDLYFEMLSDRTRRQSIHIAELKAAQGAGKSYLYELMWDTPVFDGMLRSPHSIDLPLIFDISSGSRWTAYTGAGAEAQKVARAMSDAWLAFAHTGEPGTRSLPWSAYSLDKRDMMLFNETSQASADPIRATRVFWDDVANGAA